MDKIWKDLIHWWWYWLWLVDHPTQLICIWIFICWVGGGDPCGAAELCISGPWNQKKQARTNVFSKYPCYVHKDRLEPKNRTKNWVKPQKKLFVSCLSQDSWNEGSLKIEIPKMRDPSKQEFLKRGIAREDGQQMALLVAVQKVINSQIFDLHCKHWKFFYAI